MRLILLPGLDGTGRLFAPLLRALPSYFHATLVSYPPHERLSYGELCDLVTAVLPTDEPYVIIAESFSGPVAIRLAAASPQSLRGVVLCASFASVPGCSFTRAVFTFLSRFLFTLSPPRWAVRFFLAGSDAPEELLSLFYEAASTVTRSVLGFRLRIALSADERQPFRNTTVPFLCLLPTQDRLLRRRSGHLMLAIRRDMSVAPVEAPHFVLQRNPEEAIGKIESWMREQGLKD